MPEFKDQLQAEIQRLQRQLALKEMECANLKAHVTPSVSLLEAQAANTKLAKYAADREAFIDQLVQVRPREDHFFVPKGLISDEL